MSQEDILLYYKVFRVGLLAVALYGIIAYVYFSRRSKTMELPARRMLEEND